MQISGVGDYPASNVSSCTNVVMVWQLIYALQHNARDVPGYQKIIPPNDDIRHFFQSLQPIYEEANQQLGYGDPTVLSTGLNSATTALVVPKKKRK
jgi:hypothetical protein